MMVLYHYCSADALLRILQSKSIWACEMSLANDSLEGRWISHLANNYDPIKKMTASRRNEFFSRLDILDTFSAFALCLSAQGDILSQWRAYASDATGFSIGIRRDFLRAFHESKKKEGLWYFDRVEYAEREQMGRVVEKFAAIQQQIESGVYELPLFGFLTEEKDLEQKKKEAAERQKAADEAIYTALSALVPDMFLLKNPAFSEEQEWRLFNLSVAKNAPGGYKKFEFASVSNRIVPFRKIDLPADQNPIEKVFLGPKNITPRYVIEGMLLHFGYKGAEVVPSAASYR